MTNKDGEEITADTTASINLTKEYRYFLNELKNKIRNSRFTAALAINHEVIKLYWHIGKRIIEKQSCTK